MSYGWIRANTAADRTVLIRVEEVAAMTDASTEKEGQLVWLSLKSGESIAIKASFGELERALAITPPPPKHTPPTQRQEA